MKSTATSESAEERRKHVGALLRAIPVTRMVDYGVPLGDALQVHELASGEDPGAWDAICESFGQRHVDMAARSETAGHNLTSAQAWRASSALFQCAQLAFNEDSPRKKALYERAQDAMERHAALSGDLSFCEVDTQAGTLYAWIVHPAQGAKVPKAAVLVLGGLSGWGAAYLGMGRALAARGILAILADGPGQGLSRLRSGVPMALDTLPLLANFLDHAANCGAEAFGVWGNSFGGLFAAQLAARDARVQAVCINGAPSTPVVPTFRTAREQMAVAFDTKDDAALAERLQRLCMNPESHRISGSVLVVQGGRDALVPLGAQDAFFALTEPERRATLTWEDGQHTIYNHAQERNALVADWFAEQLQERRQE